MVEVCEGECVGHRRGNELFNFMRCHSYIKPTTLEHKGEIFFLFLSFIFADLLVGSGDV